MSILSNFSNCPSLSVLSNFCPSSRYCRISLIFSKIMHRLSSLIYFCSRDQIKTFNLVIVTTLKKTQILLTKNSSIQSNHDLTKCQTILRTCQTRIQFILVFVYFCNVILHIESNRKSTQNHMSSF